MATDLPKNDICGAGSSLTGTGLLTFTGGSLAPGQSVSFDVTLQVPAGAAAGTYPNTTSDLFQAGMSVCDPATDSLTVEPPPAFSKTFDPTSIAHGGISTLTFTIDNTASALAATSLDFTDNLPAALVVADSPNASTTCTGGTLTAVPGSGVITYTGGSVSAGASCTIQVDLTSTTSGTHTNTTGNLTSSSGNSGTATGSLTVGDQPPFIPTLSQWGILILFFLTVAMGVVAINRRRA